MKLLIIEDDLGLSEQLRWSLKGFQLLFAEDFNSAISALETDSPDLVLLDLGLPPDQDNATEGLRLLDYISSEYPRVSTVVATGSEQHEHAVESVRLGAKAFLSKGLDVELLQHTLNQEAHLLALTRENDALRKRGVGINGIIGQSPAILAAIEDAKRVADKKMDTLLLGESGTGKELFAKALHDLSGRKGNFVAINSASIPENLLESELFGYEKGAFSGASQRKIGRIEHAQNGTLFLDEIGDMPLDLQAKLLRFLQERKIERVGGTNSIPVDVRIVCATHCDLKSMIDAGTFRADLFFRLSGFTIKIPPLRERGNDVLLIAKQCLTAIREQAGMTDATTGTDFNKEAMRAMLEYQWTGNVRELQNKIAGALIRCQCHLISAVDMELKASRNVVAELDDYEPEDIKSATMALEIKMMLGALSKSKGNVTLAASMLGIPRQTLYKKAERAGIVIKVDTPAIIAEGRSASVSSKKCG